MSSFNSIEISCKKCGKIFLAPQWRVRENAQYCSKQCASLGKRKSLEERLLEKIDQSGGPDACWPHKNITRNTYGLISYIDEKNERQFIGTHVAAYQLTYGPIPRGMFVLHRCPNGNTNKRCCNPRHLYLGTHQDNMDDAVYDKVMPHGERHHRAIISEDNVRAIRFLYPELPMQKIAEKFHISRTNVRDILHGRIWQGAGGPIIPQEKRGQWSHCRNGHPLTEDNVTYWKNGTKRHCTLCLKMQAERKKQRRKTSPSLHI